MLRWRLFLGCILIGLLVLLFWCDARQLAVAPPAAWVFPLIVLTAALGGTDLSYLYDARGWEPDRVLLPAGCVLITAANAVPLFGPESIVTGALGRWGWSLLTLALCLLVAFIHEMRRYREPGQSVLRLALLCLGWCYVGVLLSVIVQLRVVAPGARGIAAVATMILFVKLGDIGAYTVGRLCGRHKMTPLLSPGKTWEGALGALLFASLGGWMVVAYGPAWSDIPTAPAWCAALPQTARWILYAMLAALVGLAGDLAESLLKRDLGRKDSSNWLPGFGGTLDLLDSLLFTAPVAYVVWLTGWLDG